MPLAVLRFSHREVDTNASHTEPAEEINEGNVSEKEIKKISKMFSKSILTCHFSLTFFFPCKRGRVASSSDSQSGNPGFESRSGHLPDLVSVVLSLNPQPCL